MDDETSSVPLRSLQDRYILVRAGQQHLAFPSHWVAEILLIERSQILTLPFYNPVILGVVHNHGRIVPLVVMQQILEESSHSIREIISVVKLSQEANVLSGIGIVVDRVVENCSREQLPDSLFSSGLAKTSAQAEETIHLFRPEMLGNHLWEPLRWQPGLGGGHLSKL